MSEKSQIPETVQKFIKNLEGLDAGERARFKRNAGNTPEESRDVLGLFYKKLLYNSTLSERNEDSYFLVATLYPFEKQPKKSKSETAEPPPTLPNFADVLGQVARSNEKSRDGLDRRFERLLDADSQQLPFYLRREIQFLTTVGKKLDWAQLLYDVLHWQSPDRYIQRRWAREYFTAPAETESTPHS